MPRIAIPLNDSQIKSAKSKDKDYSLSDGNGLYLLIKKSGKKIWRFNYYRPITKTRALVSFGHYPEVSLKQARHKRSKARELISQDIDPQEYRAKELVRKKEELSNTFEKIATDWFKLEQKKEYTKATLTAKWRMLTCYIFPAIGNISIAHIEPKMLIDTLMPLKQADKLFTVKRTCQRVNEVMTYAVNIGIIKFNPLTKITAAFESPKTVSRPTISPQELPKFMLSLSMARIELQTRCLIEWQLLTITRPSEAANAKWNEIDFNKKLWIIPAEKMKMRREHIIPLSAEAMGILNIMKSLSGERDYIFPSLKPPYTSPMNNSTANMAIKRMGYKGKLVAHGLRSLASTVLNNHGFEPHIIESALAHCDPNTVRRVYNYATYLEKKRIMLDWWGDFIVKASQGNLSLSHSNAINMIKKNKLYADIADD